MLILFIIITCTNYNHSLLQKEKRVSNAKHGEETSHTEEMAARSQKPQSWTKLKWTEKTPLD